jgi:chromosome segregation ATPase
MTDKTKKEMEERITELEEELDRIDEENKALKPQVEALQSVAANRLLVMRRLEAFANEVNNVLNSLRNDFAEINRGEEDGGIRQD